MEDIELLGHSRSNSRGNMLQHTFEGIITGAVLRSETSSTDREHL